MLVAYFDCFSGVSGDMLLGALLDAGLELSDLQADVDRLGVGARLRASSVDRCGIRATRVEVDIDGLSMTLQREQHLHAGGRAHGAHDHHSHLRDVLATIDASSLDLETKQTATRVFRRLTEAEAEVHGTEVDDVDLHEVGSVDAIVDITGVIAGLLRLGVTQVLSSPRTWAPAPSSALTVGIRSPSLECSPFAATFLWCRQTSGPSSSPPRGRP